MARMIDADRLLRELTALSHGQVWPGWTYDGIRLLIERQPTLTQPNEWVSVEKRLPEDDAPAGRKQITVMVTTKAGKVTIASRVFESERDYCGKVYPARWLWSRWLNNHVTHWMELPAPPGKDNNVPTKAQNEPLTLEVLAKSQLLQMLGEKVEVIRMGEMCQAEWATVRSFGGCKTDSGCLCCHELYGKTWIAYRRPPEGEEEEP